MDYKYFLIGLHCSGKQMILEDLKFMGVKYGRLFTNLPSVPADRYIPNELYYSNEDIHNIFESNSYIYMHEHFEQAEPYYEGLSLHEYDNGQVFAITPQQFNMIPQFRPNDVLVWLDNTEHNRRVVHRSEKRKYDFNEQEKLSQYDMSDFVERLNNHPHILYFNNEDPFRISTIIYTLIQHPDLLKLYEKNFN